MWRKLTLAAVLLLITFVFVAQPAAAQNPTWRGQYYNNATLNGSPVFTRNDGNIAFNWGLGSPGEGINADNFSVRWATDVSLSAGTYRFYAQADDNIRVTFNFGFQPVIDTFASGQVNQLVTGDVNVPASGVYHIQVDYREATEQAFAFVSFANLATNPTGPNFSVPVNVPVPTGAWTAQYYANTGLAGDPVAILSEASPSHNWGNGQPLPNVPADNFSARWTSTQNLAGGTYNISARADDGVRVFVNNSLVINEFHAASGQTYSASIPLPAGLNTFVVEYYEATGEAYLDFNLTQATGGGVVSPTQTPAPSGNTATVTAARLNVRNAPSATAQVITRVSRNEVYPVNGRSEDSRWVLINLNGTLGWVSSAFVNVLNLASLPVVSGSGTPQVTQTPLPGATGNTLTTNGVNVVVRSGAGTQFARIGLLPVDGVAQVIGRNSNNTWWNINFNGLVGWVSAGFTTLGAGTNINTLPITG